MVENNVLRIYTVPAKLDVSTIKPRLSESYVPSKLDIEKFPSYIDMHSSNITCDVDSSACMAEEGQITISMLTDEFAQEGINSIQKYAHDKAVLGQQMIHARKHENVVKEAAKQMVKGDLCQSGIKFIPSERPTITWYDNELDIDGHPGKITCDWTTTTFADIQVEQAGDIKITEVQKPEIHIEYVGTMYNTLDTRA